MMLTRENRWKLIRHDEAKIKELDTVVNNVTFSLVLLGPGPPNCLQLCN